MYISSKKYTKEGRKRFGSAIFIDDLNEERVDHLTGIDRDRSILVSLIVLIITKILSANFLGIIITIPFFTLLYFLAVQKVRITYTAERILIEREFIKLRNAKILGNTLYGVGTFILVKILFTNFDDFSYRINRMATIFQLFNLYDGRFFVYRFTVRENFLFFYNFDTLITLSICFWFAYRLKSSSYEFSEINKNHISEQLVRLKHIQQLIHLTVFVFIYLVIQFFIFTRFSILFLVGSLILYQFIPKSQIIQLSLVGPSNRMFLRNIIITQNQISNLSRTTAITFGWIPPKVNVNRPFPQSIIPKEVTSTYTTGLQAYSRDAYKRGNLLGLLVSSTINLFVIIALIRFILQSDQAFLNDAIIIILILIGASVVTFLVLEGLGRLLSYRQSKEVLLIGDGFISRYIKNSLWILKGSSMEGTTIQRNRSRALVRFDKTRGMIIEWERFTILSIFLLVVIIIGIWNYLGGINLQAVPYILPSLISSGTNFIESKAQTELEFFIYGGYITWIIMMILYPRYYARSRPTLFLDMEYASVEPVLLRDFSEHQDASLQFTKSLLHASNVERKKRTRPGTFVLSLTAEGEIKNTKSIRFYAGENKIVKELPTIEGKSEIYRNLFVSALKGYPELDVIIELYGDNNLVIFTQMVQFSIYYKREETLRVDLDRYGFIDLSVKIKKQKS